MMHNFMLENDLQNQPMSNESNKRMPPLQDKQVAKQQSRNTDTRHARSQLPPALNLGKRSNSKSGGVKTGRSKNH